jgi:hypothetical protein
MCSRDKAAFRELFGQTLSDEFVDEIVVVNSDLPIIDARERAAPMSDDERRKFLDENRLELAKGHLQRSDQSGTVFRGPLFTAASAATGLATLRSSIAGRRDAPSSAAHHPEERSARDYARSAAADR